MGFIDWLDDYIERERSSAIFTTILTLLGLGGIIAALVGPSQAFKTTAIVIVLFVITSVILLVIADRKRLKNKYDIHKELLARYCDFVFDGHEDPLILIQEWNQKIYVQKNGDTREVLTIKAKALTQKVYFIRFRTGSHWDQPERYRKRVKLSARYLAVNNASGPEWHVTRSWISERKIQSIVHFHTPLLEGEEITLRVIRKWPGKCRPLMTKRISDDFTFRFSKRMPVKSIEYTIVLPVGYDAHFSPIGVNVAAASLSIADSHDDEDRRTFTLTARDFPVSTPIGMRLQLK
ncbi:hypothetical protein PV646_41895 [Streptomyces sp. ID05-26A]|nr:hypothetical protein [Streptomyces sp. ID05-26A]